MHQTSFTQCPRCGSATARPVQHCSRCYFDATPKGQGLQVWGFSVLVLIGMAFVAFVAWQHYMSKVPPYVGTWKGDRAAFTFHANGELTSDAVFDDDGSYHDASRRVSGRWSVLAGNLLTLQFFGPDGKKVRSTARVQWSLDESGKKLTLSGVGRTDNFTSRVTLRASGGQPDADGRQPPR
jgi:hypothetical protein